MGRIYDAVYGYIELDEVEFDLVNSPIFQRLHWIKQLGPLHTIFPSAQHSRLSHSIGVFHIMKKMIKHFEERDESGYVSGLSKLDKRALKLAALLHDIGHIPLSHVGEKVLQDSYTPEINMEQIEPFDEKKPIDWRAEFQKEGLSESAKLHEYLSAEIVLHNKEIDKILAKKCELQQQHEELKNKIAQIIVGKPEDQVMRCLLHSELDADRLDYLLRDSFFTGVGYGHVDLDYIISRLTVGENTQSEPCLCVENKGLRTVEHYILGRFFLQTQIVFYRKVRFLDLIFADVMGYMMRNQSDKWHMMNLRELLENLRHNPSTADEREYLHKVYTYTDAEVFERMRRLHEELDVKEKSGSASADESYINDCVKTIMDGKIPEPVCTHSILVSVTTLEEKEHIRKLKKKADQIGFDTAQKAGICPWRIKANIADQEVMKYTKRREDEDEQNRREAVRIKYEDSPGKYTVIPVAISNASILKDLVDKSSITLNVYYVNSKSETQDQIDNRENVISQAYESFVRENFLNPANKGD